MFRVITVSREYGSGGAAIARKVAEQLGWRLLDEHLVEAVARRAQVDVNTARRFDESIDSWWHRLNRAGLWAAAIEAGATPADAQFFDAETMAAIMQEVIRGAASTGDCVIVGRGAQCVLRDLPGVFRVFIYGSWPERIARAQRRLGSARDAAKLLQSVDRTRAECVRRYFGCDWKDPHLYHMMISSHLGIENAAAMIIHAVRDDELVSVSPLGRRVSYSRS